MSNLNNYRNEINQLDKEITQLVEKRLHVAQKIAAYKKEHDLPIFDQSREEQVIEKNVRHLKNPDYKPYLRDFYKKLMDISKEVQKKQ